MTSNRTIDHATGEVLAAKPSYWRWMQYLVNDWEHESDVDEIIGFAIRMASMADDGKEVYRSIPNLAKAAKVSERTAKRRKAKAIELGMFREIGGSKYGVPRLEITLPPHQPRGDNPDTQYIHNKINKQSSNTSIREGVKSDTLESDPHSLLPAETNDSELIPESCGGDKSDTPWVPALTIPADEPPAQFSYVPVELCGHGEDPEYCGDCWSEASPVQVDEEYVLSHYPRQTANVH